MESQRNQDPGAARPGGAPQGAQPPGATPPQGGAQPPPGADQTTGQGAYQAPYGGTRSPDGKPPKRLYRSETDRLVAGVCGGLRDYLGIDANLLRVVFVLLTVFGGGSGLLIYVALWALVPRESRLGVSPTDAAMDAVNEVRERLQGLRR